jgi:ADP-ribose pyrophosphatase YjhB (NUDIX family)
MSLDPPPPTAGPRTRIVPANDDRERLSCPECGYIAYDNPKIVVGAVVTWEDKILLCKRAINPRAGFWTLPAGFLELNESTEEGARREAWEEARARIEIDALLGVYNILRLSQVQIFYRARLTSAAIAAGAESLAVSLFAWEDIPWETLAFPSVHWALAAFDRRRGESHFAPDSRSV